ncbi:MAG TPA: tetratricopeptide repeat protein [Thermoanaerobaculia bacterium]
MTHFFVSYTQSDRPWAEWIAWVLEEAGLTTKIQAWDFKPGSNFVVEMHRASAEAERTLAVLSPDYLNSLYGMAEWTAAFAQDPAGEKGKLLPVKVREVSLDGLLAPIVHIDLVGLSEAAARERLLGSLGRGRAKPVVQPRYPGGPRPGFPGEPTAPPDPDEAWARLKELPLDEIPEPSPLPPGSRMPHSVNPLFVGRDEDLRKLARFLRSKRTAAIGQANIAAATGLGGIGKTQLASEFVHRYGRFFAGGVFWMSFADPAAVPAEVAACGRSLNLHPGYDALPLEEQVRRVQEAWQSPLPRLLVFDNCEDEELLDQWRPPFGGSRVLVTSRRPHWSPVLGVKRLSLGILQREASVELLRGFRPDLPANDPALHAIAEELGDLPLALHLAGSFLARYAQSPFGQPSAYLEQLGRGDLLAHPSLQGRGDEISPTDHEAHVARTFTLSFERLNPADPTDALACKLLARAAHFAPGEPIPHALLLATLRIDEEDMDAALAAEDALKRLLDLGLLESGEDGRLVLHRLVAAFALGGEGEDEAREAVEQTLFEEAARLNKAGYLAPLLVWQPHLRAVTDAASSREDRSAANLCNELGYHLQMIGDLTGARPYWERALAIRERVLGTEHPGTAVSLNNLGGLFQNQGDLARPYYERALTILEKVLGPEHPDTASSLNNLGFLLKNQGDVAGARSYFERALAIREKVLGPKHPDTALSLNNLGYLLHSQGDFAGAKPYFEWALAIWEKFLGPEHPDTATGLNNLAGLLWSQGDLTGARPYMERALAILEKVLGPEHPDTAISLNNLGRLLQDQRDIAGARQHLERAVRILEARLGPDHPNAKKIRENLAKLTSEDLSSREEEPPGKKRSGWKRARKADSGKN